jgi:bifunctional DNA-binding transcriptional regulator/antitoxin component of YhaV-PrlF toxin-antitoxin module
MNASRGELSTKTTPEFAPYKISTSGQISLPAKLRRRWDVGEGGFIETLYFGPGMLIIPLSTSKTLLEASFPYIEPGIRPTQDEKIAALDAFFKGDRTSSTGWNSITDDVSSSSDISPKRTQGIQNAIRAYKISAVGQFTFSADARRDWDLLEGG